MRHPHRSTLVNQLRGVPPRVTAFSFCKVEQIHRGLFNSFQNMACVIRWAPAARVENSSRMKPPQTRNILKSKVLSRKRSRYLEFNHRQFEPYHCDLAHTMEACTSLVHNHSPSQMPKTYSFAIFGLLSIIALCIRFEVRRSARARSLGLYYMFGGHVALCGLNMLSV